MLKRIKNILVRSIGVIMFAFIPGMAAGSTTVGWLMGGLVGVATVFSSIIVFFGVQLAWDAHVSDEDVEKGFRAAVAKQASDNKEVMEAVKTSADEDGVDFSDFDFGDIDELEGDKK
jgi:hypothetical protein